MVSRLNQTRLQVEAYNEKLNTMYSRLVDWLTRITKKIDTVNATQHELKSTVTGKFQEWEKKIEAAKIPEQQRREDQRELTGFMHRHSQMVQNYAQDLEAAKKIVSKNEYQISKILSEIRSVQVEMDLLRRKTEASKKKHFSRIFSLSSSCIF